VENVKAAFVDDGGAVAFGGGEGPRQQQVRGGHVALQQRRRVPHVLQQHRHFLLFFVFCENEI